MTTNHPLQSVTEKKWYAIYTKPRFEKKVHQLMISHGYESYLPLITTLKQWSDRKKKVQLPLIPSYVFVNIKENKLKEVLSLDGTVAILKHLKKPAIVRNIEIENIKILLRDSDNISFLNDPHIKKGDSIIVEKGVFKGLVAECIKIKGKHRIIARIEIMENLIEVNVPMSHVNILNHRMNENNNKQSNI